MWCNYIIISRKDIFTTQIIIEKFSYRLQIEIVDRAVIFHIYDY